MNYAARIAALPLPEPTAWRYRYHNNGDWKLANSPAPQWAADHGSFDEEALYNEDSLIAAAAELTALRERVAELERALQEADTIIGHDDSETEWREKWACLWVGAAINKGKT